MSTPKQPLNWPTIEEQKAYWANPKNWPEVESKEDYLERMSREEQERYDRYLDRIESSCHWYDHKEDK